MRIGDTIYYCKKIKGKVEKYEKPIPITLKPNYFTLSTTKGLTETLIYGKNTDNTYIALLPLRIWGRDTFKAGDKFYLDYAEPLQDEENGESANAEIKSVRFQNIFIRLVIQRTVLNEEEL